MKRITSWVLALFLAALLSAGANALEDPQKLVERTTVEVLKTLEREQAKIKENPKHLYHLVDDLVIPHFDFERMSRWVLGKNWRGASAEQQKRFVGEFRTLLVRTYASSLLEFANQKIVYLPFRGDVASEDVLIRSEVQQPGATPIPINYRLYVNGGKWQVYDVTIDEISLIANYRSAFGQEIREGGIDKLIAKLADQNSKAK